MGGDVDPVQWIELVGKPAVEKIDGLQRAFTWAVGAAVGAGVVLGLLAPYILRKLGLS